jgi:hypothetical protein
MILQAKTRPAVREEMSRLLGQLTFRMIAGGFEIYPSSRECRPCHAAIVMEPYGALQPLRRPIEDAIGEHEEDRIEKGRHDGALPRGSGDPASGKPEPDFPVDSLKTMACNMVTPRLAQDDQAQGTEPGPAEINAGTGFVRGLVG